MATENNDSKFDRALAFGKMNEVLMEALIEGGNKLEVKAERDQWLTTGNIAIEFECRGKPSGIAITEAGWWAQVLTVHGKAWGVLIFPVDDLKAGLKKLLHRKIATIKSGGDDNASRFILVPLSEAYRLMTDELCGL